MTERRALDAPEGDIVALSRELADQALQASRDSSRQRVILPFHKSHEDPLHRFFNAAQPGTYVQPHRHLSAPRAEIFLVLRGAVDVVVFEDDGGIRRVLKLRAGGPEFGVDLAPGIYHTFLVREPDTLLYELKLGPYTPASAKDFADWAPPEGSPEVARYVSELEARIAAALHGRL